ncbi:MAG: hypothetical protein ACI4AH_02640 [Muribaculaceae bacterium]
MDNSFELQQLKEQFEILNHKLSQQQIINERIIRTSINKNVRKINRDGRAMVAIAVFGCIAIVVDHYLVKWSWPFTIVTLLFMLVAIFYDIKMRRGLNSANALSSDLIDMRLRALRLRKMQNRWLWFSIPFLVVWLTWLVFETLQVNANPVPLLVGCGVGLVVGGIVGVRQYLRTQRQASEIVADIENLRNE